MRAQLGLRGFLLLVLGALLHTLERSGQRLPGAVGWQLGVLALAGGLLIPASGFWLVLPVAWRLVRKARVAVADDGAVLESAPRA